MVDNEFDAFMETIFGDYTDLHRELELKKRNVNSNDDEKETFSLTFALLEFMDKKMATLVDQQLQIYNGDVSLRKHVQRGDELTDGQAQMHQRYSKLEADQIAFVLDIYIHSPMAIQDSLMIRIVLTIRRNWPHPNGQLVT
ncbi:hypothetical protein MAR_008128 [Mya arenaria]|uniref:Uncharacterized protein n=1 Tax=Mya arenaria TaxID=6604 RepID=A0ABY7DY27_MYAAR|nr:hypothetical protein MAR_008128 [Mya arenaria]